MKKRLRESAFSKVSKRGATSFLLIVTVIVTTVGLLVHRGGNAPVSLTEGQVRRIPTGSQVDPPLPTAAGIEAAVQETTLLDRAGWMARGADSPGGWLESILPGIQPDLRTTAAAFQRFIQRGDMEDLRQLSPESVECLVRQLAGALSVQDLACIMEKWLGFPATYIVSRPDPAGAALEVFDAVSDNPNPSHPQSALVMTDACTPEGRVTGVTHVIPCGSRRVYAVFENNNSLRGLGHVLAVWRNPEDDRLVFAQTEPLHAGASHNYVWLELSEGWPAGRYRVDLFDPARPSMLLASEPFRVR